MSDLATKNVVCGKIVNGIGLASKLDYPTINLILNREIALGIYKCQTKFGNAILFVTDPNIGECHIINKKIQTNDQVLCVSNIEKIDDMSTNQGLLSLIDCGFMYKKYLNIFSLCRGIMVLSIIFLLFLIFYLYYL